MALTKPAGILQEVQKVSQGKKDKDWWRLHAHIRLISLGKQAKPPTWLIKPAWYRKKTSPSQLTPFLWCYHIPGKKTPGHSLEPSPWSGIPHQTSLSIKLLEFNLSNCLLCQQCPHWGLEIPPHPLGSQTGLIWHQIPVEPRCWDFTGCVCLLVNSYYLKKNPKQPNFNQ